MAQRFLQKANAIHPEEFDDEHAKADAMAQQSLYYECYMCSFGRDQLLDKLVAIVAGQIDVPEADVDRDRFRQTFIAEARRVIASLESDATTEK